MWYVKDEYSKKIYYKNKDGLACTKYANYYNERKKLQTQKIKISWATNLLKSEHDIDINKQFGIRELFKLYPSKFKSPFVKDNKIYTKQHLKYLKQKYKLCLKLCKKHHLWAYNETGRKFDSFDF